MMNCRRVLGALSGSLLAAPLAAEAQQVRYLEGQNIVLEYRFAGTRLDRLPALATELVERKVDVISAINSTAAQAALSATKTIPIVFTWVADPAALVKNLGRPDGNVTGLSSFATEMSGEHLELLKAAVPGVSRVAVLWHPGNPMATSMARHMEGASAQLGVRLYPVPVGSASELPEAFRIAAKERAGALFVIEEATLLTHRARILSLAELHRLSAAPGRPIFPSNNRRSSTWSSTSKTAKALGLTIAPSLLLRGNHVIDP